jgi:transcription antitermination factor NusG
VPALLGFKNFNHQWFALRVRSNFEKPAAVALRGRGYEEFLPLYRAVRVWPTRIREVEVPLFPGYVFCRFNAADRLPILTTPGVVHIVGVGKTPAPIDNDELAAVRRILDSRLLAEPWPFVNVGERVLVAHGSLNGLEGIIVSLKKNCRLVVSVTLLQRSVAVEIDRSWIRPFGDAGHPPALLPRAVNPPAA